MKPNITCPECKGSKGEYVTSVLERTDINPAITVFVPCYYCAGTGYQTDEEDFAPMIRWEK